MCGFRLFGMEEYSFEPHLPKDQYLQQYSKFFHSVEGNFFMAYRIWKQSKSGKLKYLKTSCSFRKYPENILMTEPLFPKRESIDSYVELLQKGFGNNLGPVFLQLSPSYSEDFGKDLSLFLNHWRRTISIPICVELRHVKLVFFSISRTNKYHVVQNEHL